MLITSTTNKTPNNIKKLDSLTQTNPSINKNNSVSYQEKKDIKLGLLGSKCDKESQSLNPTPINIQKTVLKNPINSVNKTKYNSHNSTSLNKSRNISYISPAPTIFQNPKNYTTSFSSKGYGNGFISKSSRFNNTNNISLIGPGDYSPEKNISIEAEVNKSIFGKSFFIKKKSKSIAKYIELQQKKFNNLIQNFMNMNDFLSKNNDYNKTLKKSSFFESNSKRFQNSIFDISKNATPGPGQYFKLKNFIDKKKYNKLSPCFYCEKPKNLNPIKKYGIDENENKKYGFCIFNKIKIGKLFKGIAPLKDKCLNSFEVNSDDINHMQNIRSRNNNIINFKNNSVDGE